MKGGDREGVEGGRAPTHKNRERREGGYCWYCWNSCVSRHVVSLDQVAVGEKAALSNPFRLTSLVLKTFKVCLKCQASVTQKVRRCTRRWSVLTLVITLLAQS